MSKQSFAGYVPYGTPYYDSGRAANPRMSEDDAHERSRDSADPDYGYRMSFLAVHGRMPTPEECL